jgi:hypothetical protein
MTPSRKTLLAAAAALAAPAALAQDAAPAPSPEPAREEVRAAPLGSGPVDVERLYSGWLARNVIGKPLVGADGQRIGQVDDLIFTPAGAINAVVVEGDGLERDYATVPWGGILREDGAAGGLVAPMPAGEVVFEGRPLEGTPEHRGPSAFLASELLDDVVTGSDAVDFGPIVDLAVSEDGNLVAALVERNAALGGGLYAFPFAGVEQGLHSGVERIEIPISTAEAAAQVETVDARRFDGAR